MTKYNRCKWCKVAYAEGTSNYLCIEDSGLCNVCLTVEVVNTKSISEDYKND